MIYEVKSYSDDEGRRVISRIPQDSLSITIHAGMVVIPTQMGNIPINFDFPLGYTLDNCFDNFDKFAQEKIDDIKNSSKIIPAASMPSDSKILKVR